MRNITPFKTNSGVLFNFQTNSDTAVYLTSDINALNADILDQIGLQGELFVGGKFTWDDINYEITKFHGFNNGQVDVELPDLHEGELYCYSFIVFITVKSV